MTSASKWAVIGAAARNVTAIVCFTFLAHEFEIWWIALLSLLFMQTYSIKEGVSDNDER